MRHLVVIVVAVICAVIESGWAQNRGSSRYVPPEDFDGDITRAPRLTPTRGAAVRRQRPTKAPEPAAVDDDLKPYQTPGVPARTTGRRVPQRANPPQVIPALSPALSDEEGPSGYAAPAEDPQVTSTGQEGRTQGKRRRRPKKRRRPQSAISKVEEDPNKQAIHEDKTPITELLHDDKKRSERFQSPTSRNSPSTYNLDPNYQPEKTSWDGNAPSEQHSNTAGSQYYRPQPATNRLPVADSEPIGNPQGYIESSPGIPERDAPAPYVPKGPETSVPNDASYVPVLPPVRLPSEGASRLPPEDYPPIRSNGPERPAHHSNYNVPLRVHGNTPPVADPEEVIRTTGAKPVHNVILQSDEPSVPVRSHSEVRLPEVEQPLLSPEYASSGYDSDEDLSAPNAKAPEETKESQRPSNRLPNPSEIHYDSVQPEYLGDLRGTRRIAGRRQEPEVSPVRNARPSYSSSRRDTGTKPQEYDNDAEVDRRQASQYRPPLQRAGSRYKPGDSEGPTRSRAQPTSTSAPRTRGASRYVSPEQEYTPERTRSPTRTRSDAPSDSQTSRSSTTQSPARTRGTQRYAPETVENVPRTSSRRQIVNTEEVPRDLPSAGYVPVDEYIRSQQRSPPQSPRNRQRPTSVRVESDPEDSFPVRNTLRSRPQYEVSEPEPTDSYEESAEDTNVYNSDYQLPRQANSRGRTTYGASVPEELPPTEYESPPNRQQNRQESHYEAPQNPRSRHQPQYVEPQSPRSRHQPQQEAPQNPRYRHQPQYEASQNSRANSRQTPSSRPQGRARHQNPEPSPPPRRSSGASNFACPDTYGFYGDPVQCDKYYECRNGTAEMHLCNDGLAFNEISAPKFLRCDSLRDVDCKSRPELQEPQSSKNCPRKFGLFPHETDCTKFWNCVDGSATEVQCPPGLTYNDERATCDWADLVETSCKTEDLLGFTCPDPTAHDLLDGVYSRYPHPDNCQLHFTCIKGADGLRRPRMLSCNEGLVFDPTSSSCRRPEEVPGCENFYGPTPKRKPARQPEPEPEEIEEPTPRPRRRGSIRRARN